ncbi:adenylate/guanylate cyclase domain-containing protein [Actinoallomurus bryophytorum]|uniref:Adenylate cyclase n=1 Tax=Actinoallomurus bryophytorum TaxID=1490222 RepID=A0A543CME5_9ACTN|nr:adenylate/guanylate cyclase domain-containing protein [Actinoallomurus bryophytorum]TQL98274.1 adenylate cyclase [Actinoallomurus bryophytorum]
MTEPPGPPDPRRIEELLLGGELRYTSMDTIRAAGVSEEFARQLWRALGFPHVPDDMIAFTEGDVTALTRIATLRPAGVIDEEIVLRMVRAVGQTMARLAKWQVDILVEALTDPLEAPDPAALRLIMENAETHIAELEPLLVHAWRRQLAAAGTRLLASQDAGDLQTRAAVGFADLVAFTRTSRDLDERELARLVERFEETASDVVAEHGGRLVKTLGDEVLFSADTARGGAEIGLSVAEAVREDAGIPDVRVGMAYGPVLPLRGDVFGTTVNLASRLTEMARPGTALVDAGLAAELREDDAYDLSRISRRRAHGLGVVQPYVLRRH